MRDFERATRAGMARIARIVNNGARHSIYSMLRANRTWRLTRKNSVSIVVMR
jgi:hypothetical protein